jgi:hypothetical protein
MDMIMQGTFFLSNTSLPAIPNNQNIPATSNFTECDQVLLSNPNMALREANEYVDF